MTKDQLMQWWLKPHEYVRYRRALRDNYATHYTNYLQRFDAYLSAELHGDCDYRHEFYSLIDQFAWRNSKEGHDYWSCISERRRPLGTQTK
jgi:hypothetical protein